MAWTRLNVRIPDELNALVAKHAARAGVKQSEIIRTALWLHVTRLELLELIDEGHTTDELRDPATIARLLGKDT